MKILNRSYLSISTWTLCLGFSASSLAAIQPLTENEMSQETAQAAFYTDYIAPTGSGSGSTVSDFGFFTLGVQGKLDINANIQHLQLGCGGVNGPGCDIDINNLSLSGNPGSGNCAAGANRASCDATLTNPFFRIAIKNPTSLSTRQISGFQLGAQQVIGLLTAGTNNGLTPNGINSLSGYLQVQSAAGSNTLVGNVATLPGYMDVSDPNNHIQGTIDIRYLGLLAAQAQFHLSQGGFWVPGFTGLGFSVPGALVNGSRISGLTLNPTITLPNLVLGKTPDDNNCGLLGGSSCNNFGIPTAGFPAGSNTQNSANNPAGTQGGPATAVVDGCAALGFIPCSLIGIQNGDSYTVDLYGKVTNIKANVTINQSLGMIHTLAVNSPLSLSLQSQNILWPGSPAQDVAKPGWWLSATDPVYLGTLVPQNPVSLCAGGNTSNSSTCVFPQIAAQVVSYLAQNHPVASDLGTLILNKNNALGIQVGTASLTPLGLSINNIQLAGQNFLPNCYGGLKFC